MRRGALEIFGREAGNGAIILAQSGAAVQALNDDLREVEGSADAMRETMEAGLPGAVAQIKSAFEGLMLALGDGGLTGIIERALNWVTGSDTLADERRAGHPEANHRGVARRPSVARYRCRREGHQHRARRHAGAVQGRAARHAAAHQPGRV